MRDFMCQRERHRIIGRTAFKQTPRDVHESARQGKGNDLPSPQDLCCQRRPARPDGLEPRHDAGYLSAWPSSDVTLGAIFCLQFAPEPLVQGLVRSWTPITSIGTRLAFGVIGGRHAANVLRRTAALKRLTSRTGHLPQSAHAIRHPARAAIVVHNRLPLSVASPTPDYIGFRGGDTNGVSYFDVRGSRYGDAFANNYLRQAPRPSFNAKIGPRSTSDRLMQAANLSASNG
jgi:hypothetical protein